MISGEEEGRIVLQTWKSEMDEDAKKLDEENSYREAYLAGMLVVCVMGDVNGGPDGAVREWWHVCIRRLPASMACSAHSAWISGNAIEERVSEDS